jgi:4'-phosphopantetheinyl transferase
MLNIYYGHIGLVKDPMVFDTWFEKMNQQRKKKILQCQHAEDKQRSLLAGILLQHGLEQKQYLGQSFFSITHSGDYAMCVISDRRVGVDIENRFRNIFSEHGNEKMDKVAKKCLTAGELKEYVSAEEEKKADVLLSYWTKKESYSKAMGKGLALNFATIDTQELNAFYWSDWLKEGYFCSLYVEDGAFCDKTLQEIVEI